jgi:hypothetical protein
MARRRDQRGQASFLGNSTVRQPRLSVGSSLCHNPLKTHLPYDGEVNRYKSSHPRTEKRFQNPSGDQAKQKELAIDTDEEPAAKPKKKAAKAKVKKLPLPSSLPEQVVAIRQQLALSREPLTAADMAKLFSRAKADRMEELLQSLAILGSAREVESGLYVSA